jgi:hypothetical protein
MFKWVKIQEWLVSYKLIMFLLFVALGWILCWVFVIIFAGLFL